MGRLADFKLEKKENRLSGFRLSTSTATLEPDPNEVKKEAEETLQIASDMEMPVSQVEKNYDQFKNPPIFSMVPFGMFPTEAGQFHITERAIEVGRQAIKRVNADQAISDAYFKGEDLTKVLKEKNRLDLIEPVGGVNFISDTFYKGIAVAAPMAESLFEASPYAAITTIGGAIIGGIAGNLIGGPAPEELITVPAGAKIGFTAGTMFGGKIGVTSKAAEYWYRQGVGQMIYTMNQNGVDMKYAGPIAAVAGIPYAAIEFSQMSQLTPGLRKGIQDIGTRSMLKAFTVAAKKYGRTYVVENIEEVLQEGVQIAAEDLGEFFESDLVTKGLKIAFPKFDKEGFIERAGRLIQTSVESGQAMLFLPLPGAAVDIRTGVMEVKNKNKFVDAVKEKIGVPRNAAVLAADMLREGKSVQEVDQMLSQVKAGIEAEKTQAEEKAKIVPPTITEGRGTEIARAGEPTEQGRPTIVVPDKGLLVFEETKAGLTLQNIDVVEGERRKGIGTAMVRKAEEITGKKFIDFTEVASPEGKAFVEEVIEKPTEAVGEKVEAVVGVRRDIAKSQDVPVEEAVLFRDIGIRDFEELVSRKNVDDPGTFPTNTFFANTPNLALGQKGHTGVLIEFEATNDLTQNLKISKAKPGLEFVATQGQFEVAGVTNPKVMFDNIKSVTLNPETAKSIAKLVKTLGKPIKSRFQKLVDSLEKQGWTKEVLEDGSIKYTKPVTPTPETKPTAKKVTKKPKQKPKAIREIEEKKQQERDVLGGVDPLIQIHKALGEAKAVRPKTEAEQKAERRRRVGAAAGALEASLKKGVPVEQAVLKSTGLLKGPLTEYTQLYESIEESLEPEVKNAAYLQITNHPDLRYFEVVDTTRAFQKLIAGTSITPREVQMIERVFGKQFEEATDKQMEKSGLYDRLITLWKAGLLTGIKTSGLNVLSTAGHAVSETAKDVPAALIDSGISLITKERTVAYTAKGFGRGFIEGLDKGWRYMKTGFDERDVGAKYDYKKTNYGKTKLGKAQQGYTDFVFHLLGAEDQPWYYGAFSRSLYSQSIAQGKNKGFKGKELQAFVDKLQANPTDDMLLWAQQDAETAIYTNRTNLGDLGRDLQKLRPGGDIIAPFTRTPSAVAMQIINYSPIGVIKEVGQQIQKGEFSQRNLSQAGGRSVIGTATLYLGTKLFAKGLIALGFPKSERERKLWELEGKKPNSIKVGGKWRDVQALGPVGNLLVIGGYFQQALDSKGSPTEAMVEAMAGGAKSFTEQTFVRGVNLAVDALTDPEASFERWFTSMAGSVVPTIVADIARAQDDISRLAVGPKERIQSRIPIYRKGLPSKLNVFGQDLPRYGGNVLETMIDPTRPSKIRQDVVVDELRRLWDKDIKVSPTQLGDKAGYDVLTKEENTQLWQRAGELTYKALFNLINNQAYKEAGKGQKLDPDFIKGQLIETIISKAKTAAKLEMVTIKVGHGTKIMKLAESGLYGIEEFEMQKFYGEQE